MSVPIVICNSSNGQKGNDDDEFDIDNENNKAIFSYTLGREYRVMR